MNTRTPPRILAIAGSDSSGGAGIQADIKTITMLGGYAMTAITAITAQNTVGVAAVAHCEGSMVLKQIAACVEDIGVDAIKIGMLGNEEIVRNVSAALVAAPEISARSAQALARHPRPPGVRRFPIVVDPVMVATSGALLIDEAAIGSMRARLFPLATLITPNLPELEVLCPGSLVTIDDIRNAALQLARETGAHVLAKGGHGHGDAIIDLLVAPDGETLTFESPRIATRHTHGTGCTLSSAIATLVGHGQPLGEAVRLGREFVLRAIRAAPGFGAGNGPLGHQAVRDAQT
ncbi:MAG: bifunctional hydroxymethylpyrimidine kinase/phosphomethylpyrimidine kinase [Sphingomonadales bacterium]|nr:MAG: bifunctional hydroxymethylpyrimidine kinase/phosphomethylpyrimidine kinase [Sphingomonadales bacterium]